MVSLIHCFEEIRLLQLINGNKNHLSVWEYHFGTALLAIIFCLLIIKGFVPSMKFIGSILPNDWYELMVSHRQLKQQASLSTNSFTLLVTFGIYQSQSCSVTPTGKWYCGINILLCGIKVSGHKNPLVEATLMGAQCWEATKHKLDQCHTASVIQ